MDKCSQFSPRLNSSCRGHCNFDDAISCLYMKTFLNSGASLGARMASISSWRLWPLPCGICAESARTGMLVLKPQSRSRRHGARTADSGLPRIGTEAWAFRSYMAISQIPPWSASRIGFKRSRIAGTHGKRGQATNTISINRGYSILSGVII
jgi:hypothetical protein